MATPTLSVIIPTHKRADILQLCLDALEKQTIRDEIEVIVVSDGSDPKTAALFSSPKWNLKLSFFEIGKSHQGKARNTGVEEAIGKYALFIGDDIFLEPDACEKHLVIHKKHQKPIAVLGFTTWDPNVGITDVMKWLEASGWQFGYPFLHAHRHNFLPTEIQHSFTYTSNISVPIQIARQQKFLDQVKHYGWEDIEWGHRLKIAGVPIYYQPDAKALHHHHITMSDSLKRMEILGKSVNHIELLTPGLNIKPKGLKLLGYKLTAMFPTMTGRHRKAFLSGLNTRE